MLLREAREDARLSQAELDRRAGLRAGTTADIELGRNRRPAWAVVKRLSDALGVAPETLFPLSPAEDSEASL